MKLEINDKMYELEYTINAVCDLEELTGKTFAEVVTQKGFRGLRALMWCGLSENVPGLTMKTAGKLLQEYLKTHTQEEFVTLVGGAVEQAGFLTAQGRK
jgi:hypothetical protein